jgi:hypothetical protein
VWGQELYFDGTKVRANADIDQQVPRFYWAAQQHLQELFPPIPASTSSEQPSEDIAHKLVNKYNGQRISGTPNDTYQRIADDRVCPTDPDATPLHGKSSLGRLGYHTHYIVDGGKARIILAALVTPASISDNTPMLDLVRWVRFRWRLRPTIAVGDAKYGTIPNIVGLEQDGIRAYLGKTDHSQRTKVYPLEMFRYEPEPNHYICPQGQRLPFVGVDKTDQSSFYRAPAKVCKKCPVKPQCTTHTYGRRLKRAFFQHYLDRVTVYQTTPAYAKALRKRSVWVEPLFGEAKQWHQMVQFRLRRLHKVNIQALLIAAGQNIKRLLRPKRYGRPLPPAKSAVLAVPVMEQHVFCLDPHWTVYSYIYNSPHRQRL